VMFLGVDHCLMDDSFHPSRLSLSRYMLEDMIRDPWPTSSSCEGNQDAYLPMKGSQKADE
jgi:hypothetical protein